LLPFTLQKPIGIEELKDEWTNGGFLQIRGGLLGRLKAGRLTINILVSALITRGANRFAPQRIVIHSMFLLGRGLITIDEEQEMNNFGLPSKREAG